MRVLWFTLLLFVPVLSFAPDRQRNSTEESTILQSVFETFGDLARFLRREFGNSQAEFQNAPSVLLSLLGQTDSNQLSANRRRRTLSSILRHRRQIQDASELTENRKKAKIMVEIRKMVDSAYFMEHYRNGVHSPRMSYTADNIKNMSPDIMGQLFEKVKEEIEKKDPNGSHIIHFEGKDYDLHDLGSLCCPLAGRKRREINAKD